jgi:hypothetical protein
MAMAPGRARNWSRSSIYQSKVASAWSALGLPDWDDGRVDTTQTLGVLAHRGGLLVERPELTVGVLRAVSRPSGLEVELVARRPLDRSSATERQDDIRAGRGRPIATPRRLLPAFDEGVDLRVGWLDRAGRPHWEFAEYSSSSGDQFRGTFGPSLRTALTFPPLFDQVSLVLAWPEIGFPETVINMPLPDRATVERETVSIWQAPLEAVRPAESLNHRVAAFQHEELAIEAGSTVTAPQVLHRGDHAAVVLIRLTALGPALSMDLLSVARDGPADAILATVFPPSRPPSGIHDDAGQIRARGPGASVAVVRGGNAFWVRSHGGSYSGGRHVFSGAQDFTMNRSDDGNLDLVVAWPLAGLHDVLVRIPLDQY